MQSNDLISRSKLREEATRSFNAFIRGACFGTKCDAIRADEAVIRILIRIMNDAPAVDAVEIIRCRDCTHYGESPYHHPDIGWCIIHGCHKFPDYFCADADRRVEG